MKSFKFLYSDFEQNQCFSDLKTAVKCIGSNYLMCHYLFSSCFDFRRNKLKTILTKFKKTTK